MLENYKIVFADGFEVMFCGARFESCWKPNKGAKLYKQTDNGEWEEVKNENSDK